MKRPLFFASIVITAIVFLYLEFFLSDYLTYYPDSFDGSFAEICGYVTDKETKPGFAGEVVPIVYITPVNTSIGRNKYVQLYMTAEDYCEPKIGELIRTHGKVRLFSPARNPGEFDSSLYYGSLKIAYSMRNTKITYRNGKVNYLHEGLYKVRNYLEKTLDNCLSENAAAIMKALLLGDKTGMSQETKDLYKDSGIIHILAVSGLHISLIGMGIFRLFRKSRIKVIPSAFLSIALMYMYGLLCGMSSSAFSAIVMFSLRMLAPVFKRTADMLSSMAVAELMLLLDQPLLLYNSGFLFSFGAIIGIGFVYPVLGPCYKKKKQEVMKFADDPEDPFYVRLAEKMIESLKISASVFLVTLPVYMSFYYTYPIYSVILNLIVLPLVAPLMLIGIGVLILGSFQIPLGKMIGLGVGVILNFFELLCNLQGKIPGRTWYMGHAKGWEIVLYLSALLAFCLIPWYRGKKELIKKDIVRYSFLFMTLTAMLVNPTRGLNITMIDVDQGDGIVVSCEGKNILIDGGSTSKKNVGKYQIIPYLKYSGVRRLDAVVLTHEDKDHMSGILEVMDDMEKGGIRIGRLIMPEVAPSSREDNYHLLEKRANELKIPVFYINTGESFCMGKACFTCLNPELNMQTEGANAYSTVLLMEYEGVTALFTGDMEKEGLQNVNRVLREERERAGSALGNTGTFKLPEQITILKVAHHGSMYTTDEEFLSLTKPRIALISCGRDNSYGHPHKELLERLKNTGAKVYRTDESGAITVHVDGKKLKLHTFLSATGVHTRH